MTTGQPDVPAVPSEKPDQPAAGGGDSADTDTVLARLRADCNWEADPLGRASKAPHARTWFQQREEQLKKDLPAGQDYTVEAGDSMGDIAYRAVRHNMKPEDLAKLSKKDLLEKEQSMQKRIVKANSQYFPCGGRPDLIKVGWTLTIPPAETAQATPATPSDTTATAAPAAPPSDATPPAAAPATPSDATTPPPIVIAPSGDATAPPPIVIAPSGDATAPPPIVIAPSGDAATHPPAPHDAGETVKTPEQLADEWNKAFSVTTSTLTPDLKAYATAMKDFKAAAVQAFRQGGIEALRTLERDTNTPITPAVGPIIVVNGNHFEARNVEAMTKENFSKLNKPSGWYQTHSLGDYFPPDSYFLHNLTTPEIIDGISPPAAAPHDAAPPATPAPKPKPPTPGTDVLPTMPGFM